MLVKQAKYFKLMRAWWMNAFRYTTPFVRIIPTDKCNLNCSYCFQKSKDPRTMTRDEFDGYLEKAVRLKAGLISFLGGEPLIWPHIYHAVESCTRRRLLSDLTTNGTLLDKESIDKLARGGLDLLNISVDVSEADKVSAKNSILKPDVLRHLLAARRDHGMQIRVNSVLYKDNTREIKRLVEFCHENAVPISVGFIVPHIDGTPSPENDIYFSLDDREILDDIIGYLVARKTSGYRIIDTRDYFRSVYRFLRGEKFWDCNYQWRFGWINVAPSGRIRSCTKKMDELEDRFLDLTPKRVKELRGIFRGIIATCNRTCYSNCAYNGYYFFRNMPLIVFRYITGRNRNQ